MRPDLSTSDSASESAESKGKSSGWGEVAQQLLAQVVVGRRCQRAILAALDEIQLTDTQLLMLWGIQQIFPASGGSGVGQSEVAQTLGISPAQVSGLVEQLRKQGDLQCQRAPHDRRLQLWQLTDAGEVRLQQALRCIAQVDLKLLTWPDAPLGSTSEDSHDSPTIQAHTSTACQLGEAA